MKMKEVETGMVIEADDHTPIGLITKIDMTNTDPFWQRPYIEYISTIDSRDGAAQKEVHIAQLVNELTGEARKVALVGMKLGLETQIKYLQNTLDVVNHAITIT